MDGGERIEVTVLGGLEEIEAAEWDACAAPEGDPPRDPFTTHRFLAALEASGSVGTGTGWKPRHLVARQGGLAVAVMPLYAKTHSQGEYIFDHSWAHAYMRAGGRYYPKLQGAVPFTPATGRRFLVRPGFETIGLPALVEAAVRVADGTGASSLHVTFCTEEERLRGEALGLMGRVTQQFHWENRGYPDFDAFLAALASRKRKAIRKERATAQAFGGEIVRLTGDAIEPATGTPSGASTRTPARGSGACPISPAPSSTGCRRPCARDVLLVMARREGRWIAGALNFIGRDTLYGRYWGCTEEHDCLHFELCYYQAIDWAIARGLARVEAGPRARTSSPAATCRCRPIRCTGSPIPASRAPSRSISTPSAPPRWRRSRS
jgi:uncharacterized protein